MRITPALHMYALIIVAMLLVAQPAGSADVSAEEFKKVKSFGEAVEVVQQKLKLDGKTEFAALLSEDRVRKAISKAIESYEALLEKKEKKTPGSKEYFEKEVKPVCLRIADKGEWPDGCSFFSFYKLSENAIDYDGLGLRLRIETPDAKYKAFALPIVDLYFGRI